MNSEVPLWTFRSDSFQKPRSFQFWSGRKQHTLQQEFTNFLGWLNLFKKIPCLLTVHIWLMVPNSFSTINKSLIQNSELRKNRRRVVNLFGCWNWKKITKKRSPKLWVFLGDFEKAKISRFSPFRNVWESWDKFGSLKWLVTFKTCCFWHFHTETWGRCTYFDYSIFFQWNRSTTSLVWMNVSWHNSCGNLEFSWTGNQLYHLFLLDELIPWPFLFALFWQTYICSNINNDPCWGWTYLLKEQCWWFLEDSCKEFSSG